MELIKKLFLTGTVGVGKTTLIKEVILPYADDIGGFYTEEMIERGSRKGFLLKTCDGREGILAQKGMQTPQKIGKYGVDLAVLDGMGVSALTEALATKKMIVIDEIGSMEILSQAFHAVLMECLLSAKYVIATIRYHSQPFSSDLEKISNKEIMRLTKENYQKTRFYIQKWVEQCLKK